MIPDNPLFIPIAAVSLTALIVVAIWLRLRNQSIECRDPLFSQEYRAFLGQLDIAVRSHLTVFPRLPVEDVLVGKSALRKFKGHRFDFVICHRKEMDVLCVVQMDHPQVKGPDNNQLRALCQKAGLTLLEYDVKPYRDVPTLRKEVFSACGIDEFELPVSDFEKKEEDNSPSCPKCHSEMNLQVLKKGKHAGKQCWVCINYPDCKGAKVAG